ncbi:MAG: hypothetical protein AB7O28_02720 [Vicinamibacterales bacterium]
MSTAHHGVVSGRITRTDTHQGVHGLRVEVWSAEGAPETPLAHGLTDGDGRYRLALPAGDCCECPSVYVRVRDRDCRLVHDGCLDRRCCDPGAPIVVDVALAPQALWWHLSRPLSWARIDEPLVPEVIVQEIEDGLEALQDAGLPAGLASLRVAACATPAIDGFDRLLLDAWDALQGDPNAARRVREILDALCGAGAHACDDCRPFAAEVDDWFAQPCDDPQECAEPEPCAPCAPGPCAGDGCGSTPPVVSDDKAVLLVMAALQVACGDEARAKRYVQVVLGELCRFSTLAALHAAALAGLLGDPAARAHARDLLELLCARCGPRDAEGCPARSPLACCEPCLAPGLARCLREAVAAWCRLHCYHVCEVRPPRACPGDEILIVGCGFGDAPGRVEFRAQGSATAALPAAPEHWCDDRITVRVPQGAGCGLSLRLPAATLRVCDRFLDVHPVGTIDRGFEGTSPEILRFDVKGHTPGECPLPPGEPLRIRWNTCAADHVRVEIVDLGTGAVIAARDPAAPSGRWDFTATHFTHTVRMRVRIVATGRCTPPQVSRSLDLVFQRQPDLQVQGLEVTQALQHYRAAEHLTDPADRGPDNSLQLVTNKTAWVRTYLRSGQDPAFDNGQLAGVTGTLTVERRVTGVWGTIATLAPQNGPIVAEDAFASYDAERGDIATTLNFVVPAHLMTGLLRFTAHVASPFAPCPGHSASGSVRVDVNLEQTLNAAFITIGYNGPNATNTGNLVLPAPTLANCQAETSWAMTTYPVSGAPNVRIGGTFVTNTPLNDPRSCPGCCSPNWGALLPQVAALVALDQAANPGPWVYYGIINNGIPVNVPGCNGWGATGGLQGAPVTYAHEMGHQFGLPHARCGNAGNGNAAYPIYEPYDLPVDPPNTAVWTMASIGEYGLDINTGAIANPNDAEDFMSYCGPRWISRYTYNHLTNLAALSPVAVPTGAGGGGARRVVVDPEPVRFERDERALQPMIHLLGTIGPDGTIDVASVARFETRYLRGRGRQTGYVVQHLDADGRLIAADPLFAYESEGCASADAGRDGRGCGCQSTEGDPYVPVKAMLPDLAPGASLRIVKHGEVVWERRGADKPPAIGEVRAALGPDGSLELSWTRHGAPKGGPKGASKGEPPAELDVWVRWSNDGGATWHALTVGHRASSLTVPAAQLPTGRVVFEILAHDGFHTVRATSPAIEVAPRPPSVSIFHPASGGRVPGDRLMHLWGTAASHAGHPIAPEAAEWSVDGTVVGTGVDLWVATPPPGRHEVRLRVTEGALAGEAAAVFEVVAG